MAAVNLYYIHIQYIVYCIVRDIMHTFNEEEMYKNFLLNAFCDWLESWKIVSNNISLKTILFLIKKKQVW